MEAAPDWILSTINGKIASVSLDYGIFAEIAKKVSRLPADTVSEIRCSRVSTQDVIKMSKTVQWDDMWLFGTDFQKTVWKRLFELSHPEGDQPCRKQLLSYSEFAGLCGKSSGVRAVAHAIAQNPVAIIIPCHLIVHYILIDILIHSCMGTKLVHIIRIWKETDVKDKIRIFGNSVLKSKRKH